MQEQLFHTIFNKTENDWDTDSFLKNTIDKYPYFGLAHFYALKNTLAHENSYLETATKAALFFNNPFFLNAQLQQQVDVQENKIAGKVSAAPEYEKVENPIPQEIMAATIVEEKDEEVFASPVFEKVEETVFPEIIIGKISENINQAPKEEMLFEPLHATDYFASQGIKLSDVVLNDDKLGKQLKSFTSWLKTMKKVHPDKLIPVSALVEATVQNQAAKSNIEEEVLTEAMAEAFTQQGKHIRAIETYEKLSLLNPAKSAYFAAKIESLK
jgi:hypothetical protein